MKLSHCVTSEEEGLEVRELIRRHFAMSASHLRRVKLLEDGITLDGVRVFVNQRARAGQILECRADDGKNSALVPCSLELEILWEDESLTVINKPAGIPTHPSSFDPGEPSVAGAYMARGKGGMFHPVNRLDRGTSGVMVIAANGYFHARLVPQLHSPDFKREYLAVCEGHLKEKSGEIDAPIGRAPDSVIKREVRPDGKESVTRYEVIGENERFSLVRLLPLTGRTHQLRVHLAHIGHPLAGDFLYGREDRALISRPPLHSASLRLRHPVSDEILIVRAPMPEDMENLMK